MQSTEAPSYARSFAAGAVVTTETSNTLADGMATRVPVPEALAIIRKGASRIVQVTDDEVAAAVRAYWTDTHNLAEGAGAAPLAAALQEKEKLAGKHVGLILSGGNIDLDLFRKWIAGGCSPGCEQALARIEEGRRHGRLAGHPRPLVWMQKIWMPASGHDERVDGRP